MTASPACSSPATAPTRGRAPSPVPSESDAGCRRGRSSTLPASPGAAPRTGCWESTAQPRCTAPLAGRPCPPRSVDESDPATGVRRVHAERLRAGGECASDRVSADADVGQGRDASERCARAEPAASGSSRQGLSCRRRSWRRRSAAPYRGRTSAVRRRSGRCEGRRARRTSASPAPAVFDELVVASAGSQDDQGFEHLAAQGVRHADDEGFITRGCMTRTLPTSNGLMREPAIMTMCRGGRRSRNSPPSVLPASPVR